MENKQRKSLGLKLSILCFAAFAFIISSCSKSSDNFSAENSQLASNESDQESTTDETDDLAISALNSNATYAAGGRSETISDDRLSCSGTTIVFSNVNVEKTSGTVTITFGPDGCTDKKGNVRKGQIVITWSGGWWFHQGASHTITLNNYSINGVAIEGTRTVTCTAFTAPSATIYSITWDVVASHTLTWPDNTTATRVVSKTRKWDHTPNGDTFTVTNGVGADVAASGTNRHGKAYTVNITSPLIYLGSCVLSNKVFIPVSGVKIITDVTRNKSLTIDFGAGTCDNSFTVTVDGASRTLTAKNDSSTD